MKAAKRCPICGGEPQFVYYAIPEYKNPDLWEWWEDGSKHPVILWKRIECKECKASTCALFLSCDGAVDAWNDEHIYQFVSTESAEISE